MRNLKLETALQYLKEYNFSVIPVCSDSKKPLIEWKKYQEEYPTEVEVRKWFKEFKNPNVAIVTGRLSNAVTIDIDDLASEPEVNKLLDNTHPPIAITPRGGKHLYFKAPSTPLPNNAGLIPHCDYRGEGGYIIAPPSEMPYGKYRWLYEPDLSSLPPLPVSYESFVKTKNDIQEGGLGMFSMGRRDNDLFHLANALVKGGMSKEEITEVMIKFGSVCNPPFSRREVIMKIDSAMKRHSVVNIAKDIREWVENQEGTFNIRDIYAAMHLSSREEKKNVSKVLTRAVKDNIIIKYGNKAGGFRRINDEAEIIDWQSASHNALDIWLPFGLHKMSYIYSGNIIVIAGAPNAGKTALLLNIVLENMKKYKIHYFSSEMTDVEFRIRIDKFRLPHKEWTFDPRERMENFADVIHPDDINIIDYMEIYDDFWRVAQPIREIHDRLDKGIAIIALQKDPKKLMGTGGSYGLHKPRLYLSVDKNTISIVKGKNSTREDLKLDGLSCNFVIEDGTWLNKLTKWRYAE